MIVAISRQIAVKLYAKIVALRSEWQSDDPTKDKVYCWFVLDTCSRRIVGWSIDTVLDATLVVNALNMAIKQRRSKRGSIVHADHGVGVTSWSFTARIRQSGPMPNFGSVGDALDNAKMKSSWGSIQIKLLNRKRQSTRLELTNAIFDYIEVFYNRQPSHSNLDYVSPVEFEREMLQEKPPDFKT